VSYTLSNKRQNLLLMDSCTIPAISTFVKPGVEVNRLKFVFKKIICDGSEMDYSPPRLTLSTSFWVLSFLSLFPAFKIACACWLSCKAFALCLLWIFFSTYPPMYWRPAFSQSDKFKLQSVLLLRKISVSCSRLACFQQL